MLFIEKLNKLPGQSLISIGIPLMILGMVLTILCLRFMDRSTLLAGFIQGIAIALILCSVALNVLGMSRCWKGRR